jgi:hypothetical protein
VDSTVDRRAAATLAAYEARSIDLDALRTRLLKASQVTGVSHGGRERLRELLNAVDEASDLGQNERELVAWAAAGFWRHIAESS